MAGDDEQGVVDADAETDHRGEHRRDARHVGEAGENADAGEADGDAEQRRPDRNAHGDDRTEGHQQHDHRDRDADALGALDLLAGLGDRATDLDLQPGIPADADGVVDGFEVGGLQRLLGERDGGESGRAVRAQGLLRRIERISDDDHLVERVERSNGGGDVGSGTRIGERRTVGMEDDLSGRTGLRGERVLEQVGRRLGLGAREGEVVRRLAADG